MAIFVAWIGPDLLWPGLRQHWLFHNLITSPAHPTLPPEARTSPYFLFFRITGSALVVPVVEELFWRGWLMRWLIAHNFKNVPLGAYSPAAFWVTALLFATEHGAYWDVGLLAGIAYNALLIRTRNLADCILAHAVTNGCLAWHVLAAGQWQYWA